MADCADANIASIRELAKTADAETLREIVNLLCDRIETAQRLNEKVQRGLAAQKTHIEEAQREIRRLSEVRRG